MNSISNAKLWLGSNWLCQDSGLPTLQSTHLFMKVVELTVPMSDRPFIWTDVDLDHVHLETLPLYQYLELEDCRLYVYCHVPGKWGLQ